MTYFAVTYSYSPANEKVPEIRPDHRKFIVGLHEENKIVGSGPFTDGEGGALIVISLPDGSTLVDAELLMDEDPFYREGLLESRTIRTWNPVTSIFSE